MAVSSVMDRAWEELLAAMREVVDLRSLKQVAFDLDVSGSALNHALCERERHNVLARWLPYFVIHAPNDKLVEILARLRGLEVKEREELTPEEELRRLKSAMRAKLGDEVCDLVTERSTAAPARSVVGSPAFFCLAR